VWGGDGGVNIRAVDAQVKRLREALGGTSPLRTVRPLGHVFDKASA
jgi:DNA-binding response OmpR family regulator